MTVDSGQRLLTQLDLADYHIGGVRSSEERLQLEFQLRPVTGVLTLDVDLATQLHGERAHQDALAVGVRRCGRVTLTARQQRHCGSALKHRRSAVAVELRFRQDGAGDAEAVLAVRHVECRYGRMVRHLLCNIKGSAATGMLPIATEPLAQNRIVGLL